MRQTPHVIILRQITILRQINTIFIRFFWQLFLLCMTASSKSVSFTSYSGWYKHDKVQGWANCLNEKNLSIHLTEHNIHGANDGDNVGQHVVSADVVHQGEMEEARRRDLAPVGLAAPVRDQVDAKLALRCLDSCVGGSSRDLESLGKELEVMDEGLHGGLHLRPAWRNTLGIVGPHITSRHLVQALHDDPQALSHLQHSHKVAIIAVAVGADGHVKVHQVVSIIGLRLPEVPLDASASQHRTAAAPVDGVLGRDHSDVDDSLLEKSVVRDQVLNFIQPLAELGDELIDIVKKADGDVLVDTTRSNISSMHSGSTGTLVKLHHLLSFLEEPEEGRDATDIENVSTNTHDVVENPGQFSEEHSDVLGPESDIDVQQLLHS